MSVRGLLEKKQELVNKWEEIFGVKIEEALTDEGLKAFWSAKTNLKGAMAMLDVAAAAEALDGLPDDVLEFLLNGFSGVAIVTVGGKADEEPCNVKNGTPYEVERIEDHYFYDEKFETEEAAKDFIKSLAMTSTYTVKDFRVIKVCG